MRRIETYTTPEPRTLWQRPILGSVLGTVSLILVGSMALYAVHLDSFQSILFLCFVLFGIALFWYWGISLFLFNKKMADLEQKLADESSDNSKGTRIIDGDVKDSPK